MNERVEGRLIGKPGQDQLIDLDPNGELAIREARKSAYLEELRKHGIYGRAARAVGVTRQAAQGWRRTDERFAELEREAVEEACDRAEEVMIDLLDAQREDVRFQASKFILQNKRRETYGTKVEMTHDHVSTTKYVSRVPRAGVIDVEGNLVERKGLSDGEGADQ